LTLVFGALVFAVPAGMFSYRFDIWNYLSSFAFIPTYDYRGEIAPPLNQGWTLVYEIFFYLCLTASSVLAFRRRVWLLALGLGALVILGILVSQRSAAYLTYTDPLLLEFLFGCFIAELTIRDRLKYGPATAMALVLLGMVLLLTAAHFVTDPKLRVMTWGVPAALIVAGMVRGEQFFNFRSWRLANLIGDSSFSLYLTHTFTLTAFGLIFRLRFAHSLNGLPMMPAMVVASVIAGVFCWHYIERRLTSGLIGLNAGGAWHRLSITPASVPAALPLNSD